MRIVEFSKVKRCRFWLPKMLKTDSGKTILTEFTSSDKSLQQELSTLVKAILNCYLKCVIMSIVPATMATRSKVKLTNTQQ